jgi:hypothetical protein
MKKYTLIIFDRYEVAKSSIIYHYTYEHNLGLAFKEALIKLWNGKKFEEEDKNDIWDWKRIKGYNDQIGMDFEEESYLFFEEKIKLEDTK